MRTEPRQVPIFAPVDLVPAHEVGVGKVEERGRGRLRRLDLREVVQEPKQAPRAAFEVPEVVAFEQEADKGQAVGIGRKVEPAIGLEQFVADDTVWQGKPPGKRHRRLYERAASG